MERNESATVAGDQRKARISDFGILCDAVGVYKASREDKDLPSQVFHKRRREILKILINAELTTTMTYSKAGEHHFFSLYVVYVRNLGTVEDYLTEKKI